MLEGRRKTDSAKVISVIQVKRNISKYSLVISPLTDTMGFDFAPYSGCRHVYTLPTVATYTTDLHYQNIESAKAEYRVVNSLLTSKPRNMQIILRYLYKCSQIKTDSYSTQFKLIICC